MKFITARQVIHDAFTADITGIDIKAMYEEGGIQFTAKGADNKIMDHAEKGIIQQALAVQRHNDPVAWAWNMIAYSPAGTARSQERNLLQSYLLHLHILRHPDCSIPQLMLGMLARMAWEDIRHEDTTRERKRRKYEHMGRLFKVSAEEYEKSWHKHYVAFRGYCQALPERSLPPIADVIWMMIDKKEGDFIERHNATTDLQQALKMPESAA